jgi:hypothetical protein
MNAGTAALLVFAQLLPSPPPSPPPLPWSPAVWRPGLRIIQYGTPRTGSTFQHKLLCLVVRMRLNSTAPWCGWRRGRIRDDDIEGIGANSVIKTHTSPKLSRRASDAVVFTSQKDTSIFAGSVVSQTMATFSMCPLNEVQRYRAFFGLTDAQVLAIRAYLRFWMIIRQCCGLQQSKINRQRLHGCPTSVGTDSPRYPACEAYNVTAVEKLLSELEAFRFQRVPLQCAKDEAEIIGGLDFNGRKFQGCGS